MAGEAGGGYRDRNRPPKARSTKLENRNKRQTTDSKAQNGPPESEIRRLVHYCFEFAFCFGFRFSDFVLTAWEL
jgi:hypothetical protein